MTSHRLQKVNELIKQELGRIILENEDFEPGVLVTVMGVDSSPDLHHANVAVSVFPDEKRESVFAALNSHIFDLQQLLNKKLEMRPVPKIRFVLDKSETEAQRLGGILEEQKE